MFLKIFEIHEIIWFRLSTKTRTSIACNVFDQSADAVPNEDKDYIEPRLRDFQYKMRIPEHASVKCKVFAQSLDATTKEILI